MLNWIVCEIELTIHIKTDLVLNNLQSLICHKNPTNQPTNQPNFTWIVKYWKLTNVKQNYFLTYLELCTSYDILLVIFQNSYYSFFIEVQGHLTLISVELAY